MNLTKLLVFADGSDGSIWPLDPETEWPRILAGAVDSTQRYVRVSDVIELIRENERENERENAKVYDKG